MLFFNVLIDRSVQTLWFVSVICVYYFLYPLIVYKYSISKIILVLLIFYIFSLVIKMKYGFLDARLLIYFPLFIFGIVSSKHNLIEKYFKGRTFLFCSISLFLLTACLYFELGGILKYISLILFMLSAVPGLLLFGEHFSSIAKSVIYENIVYASYCMYLFHRIIFILLVSIYLPDSNAVKTIYLTIIGMPIIIMASYYLQKYYDHMMTIRLKGA